MSEDKKAAEGDTGSEDKGQDAEGTAWKINDSDANKSTEADDGLQSRSPGEYDGEVWDINEDTVESDD